QPSDVLARERKIKLLRNVAPLIIFNSHNITGERTQMYTDFDFPSKKALKEAIARGEKITYYQPGPFGGNEKQTGVITVEGPHFPKPHKWYAQCEVLNGLIVRVLK